MSQSAQAVSLPEVEFLRPDPRLKTAMYIGALTHLIWAVVAVGVLGALTWFAHLTIPVWVWALCTAPFVLLTLIRLIRVAPFVRNHGYALRENDYVVTRGAWFREVVAVPYGRIQYSKVDQGPIMRAFGLASVELHTASAGSLAAVSGLTLAEAEALKERLVERGNARLAGL